ncbi:hypothetical protein C1H46_015305 [Malus baccata]|uniref:Uncharacterized protein n=1 Tax=Malus baccata TaxID=106549 RepID=A0A540MK01_MALBA|nr:hypothetical protein C1H46_015305 [Malus baccata]
MRFMHPRFAPPQGLPLRESLTSREFEQNYRPRWDLSAEFYKPRWAEQPNSMWMGNQEPFEQPSMPQRSSLDDKLAELAECVKQFVDSMPNTKPSAKIIAEQVAYQFTENENDSYSNFYNRWTEHPTSMWVSNQQAFQQPCVPQKLSLEDQIAKLEESTTLFMDQKLMPCRLVSAFYLITNLDNNSIN